VTELLPEPLAGWLQSLDYLGLPAPRITPITPDGSTRRFYRLRARGKSLVLMYSPDNLPEAWAWLHLRSHLAHLDLPVPKLLAAAPERGMFAMSDLGQLSLQEATLALHGDEEKIFQLYAKVLIILARLQARGEAGLNPAWCFDGSRLDAAFLRRREMDYFHGCLVSAQPPAPALAQEYDFIAAQAAAAAPWGLSHRDLQSRNLLLSPQGAIGLVDFPGARLGPAQYDLASLLNDVYVNLSQPLRERLLARYVEELALLRPVDEEEFYRGYQFAALSRILQNLGAFTHLSRNLGKNHFRACLAPALARLEEILARPELRQLEHLPALLPELLKKVRAYELEVY
jgi:aminoglycoside/choline kinase family phosphotransferase